MQGWTWELWVGELIGAQDDPPLTNSSTSQMSARFHRNSNRNKTQDLEEVRGTTL